MAYEIPQQLEYHEKIIFGLTFKQLAYLFGFGTLSALVYFKLPMHLYIKIFLVLEFAVLAIGFMFFNLHHHLKGWITWIRNKKLTGKKLESYINIEDIKDNLIYTKDKRKIAILKVESINFSIKPQNAQEAIALAFQKFLNSIDFPIQILMNTETINLEEHFSRLETQIKKDKQFQIIFDKYHEDLKALTSKNNVVNRKFYLLIPEKTDINTQIEICESKLVNIGLKISRLETEEIKKLTKKFFDTKLIENHSSYVKIGDTYCKTIYAHGYPRSVETGFLDRIVSSLGDFDLSLHIEPYDIETTMVFLNKELQKQRSDLYSANQKGIINPSLEIKYEDTQSVLRNLQKGKEKLFNVSLYINCRASSKEEVELLSKRIESELNSLLIIPKHPIFWMSKGYQSCSPLANNSLNKTRNITTEALSAFFPFTSSFLQADETGVWLGLNKSKIPIIKDIFTLSNPNGLCLASSGSGKSYMAKLLISRYLLNGTRVMVIDPQGEYKSLVEKFKGQRIDLSRTSHTIINPLDLMGHDYSEKRLALMDLMPIMLGVLSEPQKSFIDRALTEAYERKGITLESSTWDNEPPILEDVLAILISMEKRAITLEKSTIRSLINRLSMYVDGVFSFMNQHTNINFNNRFVCFDVGNMPKQIKPVMMFLVLDYIYMKMKRDLERKLLVIDEAWSLLGRTEDASYVFEIVKTCRKFNLALFLINQEVEGMLASEAGKSVLANSSYTLLMRQKPAVIKNIQETFYLSNAERAFLLTAGVGEGILLMEDDHSEIKIVASQEEHKLITTNPDEILKNNSEEVKIEIPNKRVKEKPKPKSPEIKISVDIGKGFYRYKDLKLHDIKYLISKRYKEIEQISIFGTKKEKFLIKQRSNESESHCFLTYDIAEYIKKFTDKVWLYETIKPDIVFEVDNKKYAIEIETGKVIKDKRKIENKIKLLNEEYGENWFFVVTNRNLDSQYANLGKTYNKRNITKKLTEVLKNGD